MLVFTFYACTRMVAAGDTWVAMACGRHFVNHGVDTVEPFSANSHKAGPTPEEVKTWPGWAQWITNVVGLKTVQRWHPTGWVNQNWLTHVIFYRLTTGLGSEANPYYNALVLWKFAIYFIAAVTLYYTARLYGVRPALAALSVCFAMVIGRTFFDIRPAGFSNLLVAVMILVLALASYRNYLFIWLLVPLVIFWSNVHGGYIYAFLVLVPFVLWQAIMHLPRRWMIASFYSLLWLVLWTLGNRFTHHDNLTPVSIGQDLILYLTVAAIVASVLLTRSRQVRDEALTTYHVIASCVLFLVLLPRFFPVLPLEATRLRLDQQQELDEYIGMARLSFIGIFTFAMALGAVVLFLKDKVVRVLPVRGIIHTMVAGAVAFVAMVIFNPFHLTNLTHTFVISISKNAEQWRNVHEWHRAFDWTNPVGTAVPFLIMYILAWLVLLAWIIASVRVARTAARPVSKRTKVTVQYAWPQIDIGLVIVAAMTVYMAIRSRRFIPIAGFAACPVIALLIDQAIRALVAMVQFARTGKYELPAFPVAQQRVLVIVSAVVVGAFALYWGAEFKSVYLDPWPLDTKYNSIFMRMTASYSKPFEACEFMRLNKLSGNMFNYWTEGGFIAWGQEPDPQTGKIPLQLFMDGRAQAAYAVRTFDLWSDITSGGPLPYVAAREGREPTGKEYVEIGKWVTDRLRKHGVWVVLMPDLQFDKPLTLGLEHSPDWRAVYSDDKQKMLVDIKSEKGAALYEGMFTGKTIYPNEYLANLDVGHYLLLYPDVARKKEGLERLIKALYENPSPAPMRDILVIGGQFRELRPRIDEVCQAYAKDFEDNQALYAHRDGYSFRLHVARMAAFRLKELALATGDTQKAKALEGRMKQYEAIIDRLQLQKKW